MTTIDKLHKESRMTREEAISTAKELNRDPFCIDDWSYFVKHYDNYSVVYAVDKTGNIMGPL